MNRHRGFRSSAAMLLLSGFALAGCGKDDCDTKGGPLSADERSLLGAEAEQSTFKLTDADSTQLITTGTVQINIVRGSHSKEEHCNWIFETGGKSLGVDLAVYVAHYGVGCEENLNSAGLGNGWFHTRFIDVTAQDHLLLNGIEHNGVYVIAGDAANSLSDIWYSRSEGLLAFTKGDERWTKQ